MVLCFFWVGNCGAVGRSLVYIIVVEMCGLGGFQYFEVTYFHPKRNLESSIVVLSVRKCD